MKFTFVLVALFISCRFAVILASSCSLSANMAVTAPEVLEEGVSDAGFARELPGDGGESAL